MTRAMPGHEVDLLTRENAIGGRQQQRQPRIDQIDLREPDGEIASQDHTLVEQIVDDVEQRCIFRTENRIRLAPSTRRFGSVRTLREVRAHWMKL